VANRAKGDGHGLSDVAHSDGGVLYVHIRLAALRRVPVGAGRQVLCTVHGRCIIQLSSAGEPLNHLLTKVTADFLLDSETKALRN